MIRSLFVVLVIALLMTSVPAPAAGQTATPVTPLAACTVAPRTPEELEALLDGYVAPSPTPLPEQATPDGGWRLGIDALPAGTPADSTEVEAVVQQEFACLAAGDFLRYLALFTDDEILGSRILSGLGAAMATPDLRTPTPSTHNRPIPTVGLFHARLLPDGRLAAVAPSGAVGLPVLYLFARQGERWLIDDRVLLGGPFTSSGAGGHTYTGALYATTGPLQLTSYGWGLEFGPEWTPVIEPETGGDPSVAVVSNGVSFVVAGVPYGGSEGDLAACVRPLPADLARGLKDAGLRDFARAVKQESVLAPSADGASQDGVGEQRAIAVYDLAASADERLATDGALRISIECRTMAGGAWTLGITHIAPAAVFEAEAAKRDELLATFEDWDPTR